MHLRVAEGQCDYINASPISLKDPRTGIETTYIAAQVSLPLPFSLSCNVMLSGSIPGSEASRLKSFLADDMA